jgi:hypothetical protein
MSDTSKRTHAKPHPASQPRTPREIADEAATGKPELEIVEQEAEHASAEAKAQAKQSPPDIISKKQRKRL